jgi:hypothetical protein
MASEKRRGAVAVTRVSGGAGTGILCAARAVYGLALLAMPRRALGGRHLGAAEPGADAFARVLGARQLAEALLLRGRPARRLLLAGVAVDAAHALSMLVLCVLSPKRRRLAAANAVTGALLAAWGAAVARRTA